MASLIQAIDIENSLKRWLELERRINFTLPERRALHNKEYKRLTEGNHDSFTSHSTALIYAEYSNMNEITSEIEYLKGEQDQLNKRIGEYFKATNGVSIVANFMDGSFRFSWKDGRVTVVKNS